jgi:hypothetical protein
MSFPERQTPVFTRMSHISFHLPRLINMQPTPWADWISMNQNGKKMTQERSIDFYIYPEGTLSLRIVNLCPGTISTISVPNRTKNKYKKG